MFAIALFGLMVFAIIGAFVSGRVMFGLLLLGVLGFILFLLNPD
jgi:hypothetical protein